jgi:ribosomal protein L32
MNQPEVSDETVRDGSRYMSSPAVGIVSRCLVCATPLADVRARFCSPAHRQLAYRLRRRAPVTSNEPDLRRQLQRRRLLTAHTVYECPRCQERFVAERSCPSCHLFGRSLGMGGHCPECDQPILLADLIE